jgi:hypothetical protein
MDSRRPPDRGGIALRHPERPVPSRRRLLWSTTPTIVFFLVAGWVAEWWASRAGQRVDVGWFPLVWWGVFAGAWLVLAITEVPRPLVMRSQQRTDIAAARRRAVRSGRLPESPSVRIGAAVHSCAQLELGFLLLVGALSAGTGLLLWPALPWWGIIVGWAVLVGLSAVGVVRSWVYLRLYEMNAHVSSS